MANLPRTKRLQADAVFQAELTKERAQQAARQRPQARTKDKALQAGDVAVWVETYEAPEGEGFVVLGEVQHDTAVFVRRENTGPVEGETQDWTEQARSARTPP